MTRSPHPLQRAHDPSLLDGRKSQTRRIIKHQPPDGVTSAGVTATSTEGQTDEWCWLSGDPRDCDTWGCEGEFSTGYRPGDRLWVRHHFDCFDVYFRTISKIKSGNKRAAPPPGPGRNTPAWKPWDSPIFCPRWASRLTLIVTNVRVERLQDISEADAIAEGCPLHIIGDESDQPDHARLDYIDLWNSLNAKRGFGWETNPWVVAVSFETVRGNIDQVRA